MALTYKELQQAMVGNKLSLGKLWEGVRAADSLASLPAGVTGRRGADGTFSEGLFLDNIIDIRSRKYGGSCSGLETTMIDGTLSAGSSFVDINAPIGVAAGNDILIGLVGAGGASHITTVTAVENGGTRLRFATPTITQATSSVPSPIRVYPDDSRAFYAAMNDLIALREFGINSGTICGQGTSLFGNQLQGDAGKQGQIFLPKIAASYGSIPFDLRLDSVGHTAWVDQGSPSATPAGGWVIQSHIDDRSGTGAIISGAAPDGSEWPFTFCFLSFGDVEIRAPRGNLINGVNGIGIARVSGKNLVVSVGAPTAIPSAYDKYGIQLPAFNCVPGCRFGTLTVSGFKRGVIAYERGHISYLYTNNVDNPVTVDDGSLVIDNAVIDIFTTFARSTRGGDLRVGMAALDQGTYVVNDSYLRGEITYTRGSGGMGVVKGSGLRVRRLGVESRTAPLSEGATTIGNPVFTPRGTATKSWHGIGVAKSGDVALTAYGDKLYRQHNGTGALIDTGAGTKNWFGATYAPNGDLYGAEYGGGIWRLKPASGSAWEQIPVQGAGGDGLGNKNWKHMAASPNGKVYAVAVSDDIYVLADGGTQFAPMGVGAYNYTSIAVLDNLDVYVSIYGGGISRSVGGTGTFTDQSLGTGNWTGLGSSGNDLYVVISGVKIQKRVGGAGALVDVCTDARAWQSIAGGPDGRVIAAVDGGDTYSQQFPLYSAVPLSAT